MVHRLRNFFLALKLSKADPEEQPSPQCESSKLPRSFWRPIGNQVKGPNRLVLVHDRLIVVEIASRESHHLHTSDPLGSAKSRGIAEFEGGSKDPQSETQI
jgi:hypothetical protein